MPFHLAITTDSQLYWYKDLVYNVDSRNLDECVNENTIETSFEARLSVR